MSINHIPALEITSKTDEVYNVISPDGFSIHFENQYESIADAEEAFTKWARQYERQGYYSSVNYGRIPLDELRAYCKIVPEERYIAEDDGPDETENEKWDRYDEDDAIEREMY